MKSAALSIGLGLLLLACRPSLGTAPPEPTAGAAAEPPASANTRAEAEARTRQGTRFRVGDFVTYRYSGSYTQTPVALHESVLEVDGTRLVIDVSAQRGHETRRWIQIVTDTPENRDSNVVDELYEVVGEARNKLDNADNRDLLRLYEWTLPPCQGDSQEAGVVEVEMPVAGARLQCKCAKAVRECNNEPAQVETCECPELVWLHASGQATALDDGEVIWKTELTRFGNAKNGSRNREPRERGDERAAAISNPDR